VRGRGYYLTRQCGFLKRNGDGCKGAVREGDAYCWAHDARYEEARRRGQSRGGKHKPSKELVDIKQRLSTLAEDVLEGRVNRATGAVVSQILNVLLRAIDVELKAVEQLQLIERLEVLEQQIEMKKRSQSWGA
jgi:hypothetical protein